MLFVLLLIALERGKKRKRRGQKPRKRVRTSPVMKGAANPFHVGPVTGGRGPRFPFANVCAWLCERVRTEKERVRKSVCVVRALFGWLCPAPSNTSQIGVDGGRSSDKVLEGDWRKARKVQGCVDREGRR